MERCLCGKEAKWRFWGKPRCDEHIDTAKRCFNLWPPVPGSSSDGAIEPIEPAPVEAAPVPPRTPANTFQFLKTKL